MRRILLLLLLPLFFYAAEYKSLWLASERASWPQLRSDLHCDVAIVGGGISGVATLYYLLTSTEKKVVLLERDFIASGATGHNAGLPVAYIERPIGELIEEFGVEPVKQTCSEMDSAWKLLEDICAEIGFEKELFPIPQVHFGFPSLSSFLQFLEQNEFYSQFDRHNWLYLALESVKDEVPSQFHNRIQWVSHKQILSALETRDTQYIAAAQEPGGRARMNSALFCSRLLQYLAKTFPKRCFIYEKSTVSEIQLQNTKQILHHFFGKVFASDIVLCTNAYTNFVISDLRTQKTINKLKEWIIPREGFLAAYPSQDDVSSLTGFMGTEDSDSPVQYWYLSRAPVSQGGPKISLIGGPEYTLTAPLTSEELSHQSQESLQLIQEFLSRQVEQPTSFPFFWHGTMGYTHNGLRRVGEDPDHSHLWYNLGCNGIGILPAIAGGQKIARQMKGETFSPSLFDPL